MECVVLYWTLKAETSLCLHQLVKFSEAAETDHFSLLSCHKNANVKNVINLGFTLFTYVRQLS